MSPFIPMGGLSRRRSTYQIDLFGFVQCGDVDLASYEAPANRLRIMPRYEATRVRWGRSQLFATDRQSARCSLGSSSAVSAAATRCRCSRTATSDHGRVSESDGRGERETEFTLESMTSRMTMYIIGKTSWKKSDLQQQRSAFDQP